MGLDLAHLQVGAGGDMGIAAAIALGEVGDPGKLPVREDAVRHPQPAHIGVLVRRHVEQAEVAPAEIVRRLGVLVVRRLRLQPVVAVERMQFALELLLFGKLAAGLENAVLGAQMRGVGAGRFGSGRALRGGDAAIRAGGLGDLQARNETFQVTLLLGVEIAGHRSRCWFACATRMAKHRANGHRWPGMLQSSKDRAKPSGLVLLGNSGSQTGARCHRGQPQQSKLKIYAGGGRLVSDMRGAAMAAPPQDWPADAARPTRPAPYRRF